MFLSIEKSLDMMGRVYSKNFSLIKKKHLITPDSKESKARDLVLARV